MKVPRNNEAAVPHRGAWIVRLKAMWSRLVARLRGASEEFAGASVHRRESAHASGDDLQRASASAGDSNVADVQERPGVADVADVTLGAAGQVTPSAGHGPNAPANGSATSDDTATKAPENVPPTAIEPGARSPAESAALDTSAPPPVRSRRNRWQKETIRVGNGRIDLAPWVPPERTYRVFVPGTLSPDPCIVLMLHGCQQTPEDIAEGTRLNEHAEDLGWIVVYPEQARAANKYGCWNWFDPANERGDGECALVMAIHQAVRARLKLNEPRSFLAGMSAGGALSSLLALRYARHFAGVAIHSGLPYGAAREPWGAKRVMREGAADLQAAAKLKSRAVDTSPLPAMILHGSEDAVVHRNNAALLIRQILGWNGYFPENVDWATSPLPPAVVTQSSTTYGHPYVLRDFGEALHPPVREVEVVGMGHAWSGGDSALPFHDEMGPDASALMMEFFATLAERG